MDKGLIRLTSSRAMALQGGHVVQPPSNQHCFVSNWQIGIFFQPVEKHQIVLKRQTSANTYSIQSISINWNRQGPPMTHWFRKASVSWKFIHLVKLPQKALVMRHPALRASCPPTPSPVRQAPSERTTVSSLTGGQLLKTKTLFLLSLRSRESHLRDWLLTILFFQQGLTVQTSLMHICNAYIYIYNIYIYTLKHIQIYIYIIHRRSHGSEASRLVDVTCFPVLVHCVVPIVCQAYDLTQLGADLGPTDIDRSNEFKWIICVPKHLMPWIQTGTRTCPDAPTHCFFAGHFCQDLCTATQLQTQLRGNSHRKAMGNRSKQIWTFPVVM